ncbi:MAG: hypothetical protein WBM99_10590 [Psychromonas sp.]
MRITLNFDGRVIMHSNAAKGNDKRCTPYDGHPPETHNINATYEWGADFSPHMRTAHSFF